MAYAAVRGGRRAIQEANRLLDYYRLKGGSAPIEVRQIRDQMRLAVDQVMGEGSLYDPDLAALALKQAEGDTLEAAFLLRAFRSTVPRNQYSLAVDTSRMRVIRRISAAFKDVPGGQFLGPTRDYTQRLLRFE
ncbi:MAG TPA: carbon-phosphorus lyase complex subunit PhnI, partial [Alicyclobacillus sp.]|nr:carbon-phosphorus lyase complex subunit PhnI [Alicyclobacillus sp.]